MMVRTRDLIGNARVRSRMVVHETGVTGSGPSRRYATAFDNGHSVVVRHARVPVAVTCVVLSVLLSGACGSPSRSARAQRVAADDAHSEAAVASAPSAASVPAPPTTAIPEDLQASLREQAMRSEMAKDALGDGHATARATSVVPWYAD